MTDDKKGPLEMPKAIPQMRVFRIPSPDPDDPRAICPWCGARIGEMDLRFDPIPADVGTLLVTFRCKTCQIFQGHQIVPADWILARSAIDLAGGNIHKVLADLHRRRQS